MISTTTAIDRWLRIINMLQVTWNDGCYEELAAIKNYDDKGTIVHVIMSLSDGNEPSQLIDNNRLLFKSKRMCCKVNFIKDDSDLIITEVIITKK